MIFEKLEPQSVFRFEGAVYLKYLKDNEAKCVMLKGFDADNNPEKVKADSEVEEICGPVVTMYKRYQ